jgi:hypothetical protein
VSCVYFRPILDEKQARKLQGKTETGKMEQGSGDKREKLRFISAVEKNARRAGIRNAGKKFRETR